MSEIPQHHPVERLTAEQRETLSLVGRGYKSKEIARMLEITHYAVNRRIDRGVERLGVSDRFEAGRMVVEFERQMCDPITPVCDPIHLPERQDSANFDGPDEARPVGLPWPFATSSRRDGLPTKQRLLWAVIGIPCLVMLAWGTFLSGVAALDTLHF